MKHLLSIFFFSIVFCVLLRGQDNRGDSLNFLKASLSVLENKKDSLHSLEQSLQNKLTSIRKQTSSIDSQIETLKFELSKGEIYICRFASILRKNPESSEILVTIKGGELVKVLKQDEKYLKVEYNGTIGWTEKTGFLSQKEKILLDDAIKKQKEELASEYKKIDSERKAILTKKFGASNAQKIIESKIWLGMTTEMANESWGPPIKVNKDVYQYGVLEQWIYNNNYLYFEDGILKSWQER